MKTPATKKALEAAGIKKPAVPLYQYQRDWFLDRSRFKIGMFTRQGGKTFTTGLEIADDCFEAEARSRRSEWVILSRGERQSRVAIDAVKMHCRAYDVAISELDPTPAGRDADGIVFNKFEIAFPAGSSVIALPANPDTARGYSRNVFLDEFALHQDSREIWKALFPVISRGFRLRVVSTPNGLNNKFHELMTAKDSVWSRHIVDIHRAVADGLPFNIDELRAGMADEDGWAQEYELKWLDEASAWLSYELISSCEHDDAGKPELYQGGRCFYGEDIGRRKDLWVGVILELVGDVLWVREISILERRPFHEQEKERDRLVEKYHVARGCMDQTGMGEKPVEDAQRRWGEARIEGVLFTGPNKLTLATQGKEKFEDRAIRIPLGDVRLRADLHSLKKMAGPTGAPRFVVEDDSNQAASHADRAWSLFLAINAAAHPLLIDGFSSGIRRGSGDIGGEYRAQRLPRSALWN